MKKRKSRRNLKYKKDINLQVKLKRFIQKQLKIYLLYYLKIKMKKEKLVLIRIKIYQEMNSQKKM